MLWRDGGKTWHAVSCAGALFLGFVGLLAYAGFLHVEDARLVFAAIKIGTFGLLLPVYFTVAHRMFPFFAGNVVKGYRPWRPMWRSEEHTSELQSLMRISYAVFCLKKKKKLYRHTNTIN